MQREVLLRAVVCAPLAVVGSVFSPIGPSRTLWVDEHFVQLMETISASLAAGYAVTPTSHLADSVLGHHEMLVRLLDQTKTNAAHRHLQVVTGRTSGLMALVTRRAGTWSWSQRFTNQALDLAREAGHGGLEACALSDLGELFAPGLGDGSRADPERSLSYAAQADAVAQLQSPPAMRSFCAARLAAAYAAAGDSDAALAAQERAERTFSADTGPDDFGGQFIGTWNEATLTSRSAFCHLTLGRLDEAEDLFQEALARDLSEHRAAALTDLASIAVARKEPEQACDALSRAYTEAVRMESQAALQRILRVRRHLAPWSGEPSVRDLDERLAV